MKVRASKFYGHDAINIDFPKTGLVVITGHNGAGKSTRYVETLAWALYGKTVRDTHPGAKASVEVELGGLKISRSSGKLAWSINGAPEGASEGSKKGQERLEERLGLTFDGWRKSCVFSSYDANRFSDAKDSERKALLEGLLGLGRFDAALTSLRDDKRQKQREKDLLESALTGDNGQLEMANESLTDAYQQLADIAADVDDSALRKRLDDTYKQLLAAQEDEARKLNGDRVAQREFGAAMAKLRELSTELDYTHGQQAPTECETCGRPYDLNEDAHKAHEDRVARLDADVKKARDAANSAKTTATQAKIARDAAAALVQRLTRAANEINSEILRVQGLASVRDSHIKTIDKLEVKVEELERRIEERRSKLAIINDDLRKLGFADSVLGLQGARVRLFEEGVRAIEASANNTLSRMNAPMALTIKTYQEKKTGGVSDKLSVAVEGLGADNYAGASGGERRRIDVALMLAIADLYAAPASVSLPLLFDDTFDTLDVAGVDAVATVLEERAASCLIVLITQNVELAARCKAAVRVHVT